jgi:plastocyanin
MVNLVQAVLGIIIVLIVVGGLLYIFYSRTNAVEKTGYGALIMLIVVSAMIPIFWIAEGNNQAQAKVTQHQTAVERGMETYAENCTAQCYSIVNDKVVNPTYNGYTMDYFSTISDDQLRNIIGGGVYNPKASYQPPTMNAIPRSDEYGGALDSNDVDYLMALIRSTDPKYLAQNGYDPKAPNGFAGLPAYLQANNPTEYANAVTLGKNGQFGTPVDETKVKSITIDITDPGQNGVTCASQSGCFSLQNIQVKVGTTITWVNKSKLAHTVTAIQGTNLSSPQPAKNIFDSGKERSSNLLQTGESFTYTVDAAAYNADPTTHRLDYYCEIHPDMLAQLVIVK